MNVITPTNFTLQDDECGFLCSPNPPYQEFFPFRTSILSGYIETEGNVVGFDILGNFCMRVLVYGFQLHDVKVFVCVS